VPIELGFDAASADLLALLAAPVYDNERLSHRACEELLHLMRQGQFALRKLGVAEKTAPEIWNAVLAA
jgi:hypothetical protein